MDFHLRFQATTICTVITEFADADPPFRSVDRIDRGPVLLIEFVFAMRAGIANVHSSLHEPAMRLVEFTFYTGRALAAAVFEGALLHPRDTIRLGARTSFLFTITVWHFIYLRKTGNSIPFSSTTSLKSGRCGRASPDL